MIHYQLQCDAGHSFDGWFAGSAAFEQQAERGLIACPFCASTKIERGLMAPSVVTRGKPPSGQPKAPENAAKQAGENHTAAALPEKQAGLPDAMRAKLQRLRAEIEQNCDYVGRDFAAEARRIQTGEAEKRPIYGETSVEQAESLAKDGIDVARIPWLPRSDG